MSEDKPTITYKGELGGLPHVEVSTLEELFEGTEFPSSPLPKEE